MGAIGIRELSRRTRDVIEEVERTGRPVLITRYGRPAVAIVSVDPAELEDFILANAPEFTRGMRQADEELAAGETRALRDVVAEIGGSRSPQPLEAMQDRLTAREREVLRCLSPGASTSEIAERLFIAPNTVRTHIRNILSKLALESRADLVEHSSGQ